MSRLFSYSFMVTTARVLAQAKSLFHTLYFKIFHAAFLLVRYSFSGVKSNRTVGGVCPPFAYIVLVV